MASLVLPQWLVPLALTVAFSFVISAPLNRIVHGIYEHIAVSFTNLSASFYINGQFAGITFGNYSIPNDNNISYASIGASNGEFANGIIDDFSIWNTALSQQDILDYMYCSLDGSEQNLIGFWNFEEGPGSGVVLNQSNGQTGIINGALYDSNVYQQTCQLLTENGCDSVAVLNLTVNQSDSSYSSIIICDSYTWDGVTYTTSGTYSNIYTDVLGCDSVHTLNLTINSSNTGTSSATACDSYTWDGVAYTVSGAYTNTYTNAAGCDSVHTLNLTINSSNTGTSSATACDSYTWDGVAYTVSGAYTNTYTNAAGCDSVHTLNLTINNSTSSSMIDTACGSYAWSISGQVYTTSGIYVSTSINSLGCIQTDSLILSIICYDCNGDPNGTAFIDSCGNCVGGNTGNVACISFSPNVVVTLSNTDCDSLTDLTVSVSQDPNEPDMSTALFVSDGGSFAISMMSVGDTIGSAFMSANSGNNTFTTVLIVSSILSNNQAIIQSQDINTGLVLGSFTISNTSPGVSILAQSVPDNNNVTSGNSSVVTFSNVFLNPGQSLLTFSTTINSELGDVDTQSFPFHLY